MLPAILDEIIIELDSYELIREKVIAITRELNRLSGRGIALLVMGKPVDDLYDKGLKSYGKLAGLIKDIIPIVSWKSAASGVEEFAEFAIMYSLLNEKGIPSPKELDIPNWLWLAGLGDVVGELRRVILNRLLADNVSDARKYLKIMQDIYYLISGLSFSKAIISNFRKKVDVARMTVERTESDVLNYMLSRGEQI